MPVISQPLERHRKVNAAVPGWGEVREHQRAIGRNERSILVESIRNCCFLMDSEGLRGYVSQVSISGSMIQQFTILKGFLGPAPLFSGRLPPDFTNLGCCWLQNLDVDRLRTRSGASKAAFALQTSRRSTTRLASIVHSQIRGFEDNLSVWYAARNRATIL
jgi:hypothetical protein